MPPHTISLRQAIALTHGAALIGRTDFAPDIQIVLLDKLSQEHTYSLSQIETQVDLDETQVFFIKDNVYHTTDIVEAITDSSPDNVYQVTVMSSCVIDISAKSEKLARDMVSKDAQIRGEIIRRLEQNGLEITDIQLEKSPLI